MQRRHELLLIAARGEVGSQCGHAIIFGAWSTHYTIALTLVAVFRCQCGNTCESPLSPPFPPPFPSPVTQIQRTVRRGLVSTGVSRQHAGSQLFLSQSTSSEMSAFGSPLSPPFPPPFPPPVTQIQTTVRRGLVSTGASRQHAGSQLFLSQSTSSERSAFESPLSPPFPPPVTIMENDTKAVPDFYRPTHKKFVQGLRCDSIAHNLPDDSGRNRCPLCQ
jgi:hypothetical protein